MNQLVRLTTNDLKRAAVITDTLIISEHFNKRHDIVLRDVRTLQKQLEESIDKEDLSLYKIVESEYINERGREYIKYDLNRMSFMMLVMGYNTKKAFKVKNIFIKQFDFMEHELIARGETRHIGISIRKDMTKAISDNVPEGNFKRFAYSNYTGLVYKKVLGMKLKKYKELNNIPKGVKNRDFLSISQLEKVQYYESKIADIVEVSSDLINEKQLYQNIKIFIEKDN